MKSLRLLAGLLFAVVLSSSQAKANEIVDIWVGGVFIPVGFDDNDEIVVGLDGLLPNSCHQLLTPTVVREEGVFKVSLKANVSNPPCLIPSLIPFSKIVTIGQLGAGDYSVEANGGLAFENLHVEAAPAGTQDTYTYAAVEGASIDRSGGRLTAVVYAKLIDTCTTIQEVKVFDHVKTIEVLPIVTRVDNGNCQPDDAVKQIRAELPATVGDGRHLLHVRSVGGQSVNLMFSR